MTLKAILELEETIKNKRIEMAMQYLAENDIDPFIMSDTDLLSVYTMLETKARIKLQRTFNEKI